MLEKPISKSLLYVKLIRTAICAGSNREFYDRIADIYDIVFSDHIVHIENIVTLLTGISNRRNNSNVLDLGCGTGMLSKALATHGFCVISIDISLKSLRVLQRIDRRLTLIQGDIESIPLSDSYFQTLICLGVWRHLKHFELVLDEICRVLSEEGNFILGYFPPKLGGVVQIQDNFWGKTLARVYNRTVRWLGYVDRIDFDPKEQIFQTTSKRFKQIQKVDSGQHWYMILACNPRKKLSSI